MKAVHLRARAEAARRARFEAARRVVEIARQENADLMILAGDTFEHNAVERAKVREVANLLSRAPCPVYIIPGNHDPAVPGSVWEDDCWRAAANVTLLLRAEPVEISGAVLYPCPAFVRTSVSDPTAWIPPRSAPGIRIGIAHGSVEGPIPMELCYPIVAGVAERLGLDYLALGHYHSTAVGVGGSSRTAYAGTHEPTAFGERDSGNILLIDIDSAGAEPRIRPISTRTLDWLTIEHEINSAADLRMLLEHLESIDDPEHKLLRCVLTGDAAVEDDVLERLAELESRFLYAEVDRNGLTTSGGDAWIDELPPGYLRTLGERLRQDAVAQEDAAAALGDLRRLWREVRA
jgi:DNA repair exonuclease SbcCD nuclease subunit